MSKEIAGEKHTKNAIFFCTFPDKERGFTGANIGNKVTYDLLKNDLDITVVDLGIKDFNPVEKGWAHTKYNIKILIHYFQKLFYLRKLVKKNNYYYFYFLPGSAAKGHLRDVLCVWMVRKYVKKIIVHNRNGNFHAIYTRKWHARLTRYFTRSIDMFIFLSENLRALTNGFIPVEKTRVIFNPIDEEVMCTRQETDAKITNRESRNGLQVLFLSNMILSKGYMDLAKAAAMLLGDGLNNFKMHFLGRWNSTADENDMRKFINDNGLVNHIQLHGKVTDRNIVKQFILNSDLFVLPTYYPVEAQPRSIIEALNAATPVIATRHASIPEVITNECQGILVDKCAPRQIADAVHKYINYDNWKVYAVNCRNTYEARFSHEAIKRELIAVFTD